MEVDHKLKEDSDPHMSGAYIRSLVKQLRTKDPMNPNSSSSSSSSAADSDAAPPTSGNAPSKMAGNHRAPPPIQHHKKQVRRRLHTTRPYQERLLNMAEARREIVTALKFHRAAMKKAAAVAGEQPQQQPQTPPETPARCQEGRIKPRKIPKSYQAPSSSTEKIIIPANYPRNNFAYDSNQKNFCYPSFPSNSFPWSPFQINSQSVADNLDIALPEQTLGLNLNFHDFSNLDANLFANGTVSASSSSSSPSLSIAIDQEAPHSISAASDAIESNIGANSGSGGGGGGGGDGGGGGGGGGLHVAVGEEEMAEIRSIGEKHEMEWSDKMNLVKSAWWLRFMKMGKAEEEEEEEEGAGGGGGGGEGFQFRHPFDQILEFPDWMNNGNERCFEEQLLNDYCSHDYQFFHDPALPW